MYKQPETLGMEVNSWLDNGNQEGCAVFYGKQLVGSREQTMCAQRRHAAEGSKEELMAWKGGQTRSVESKVIHELHIMEYFLFLGWSYSF